MEGQRAEMLRNLGDYKRPLSTYRWKINGMLKVYAAVGKHNDVHAGDVGQSYGPKTHKSSKQKKSQTARVSP